MHPKGYTKEDIKRLLGTSWPKMPEGQLLAVILGLLAYQVGYGLYLTFGSGNEELRDPIDEHAKMHELGIAHGHGGSKEAYTMSGKLEKHSHPPDLLG